jgi:cation diffusion facilitator family transporter
LCALEHDKQFLKKQADNLRDSKKLVFVAFICFLFMGCEAAGGIIANSLAILADAAHMFSDVAGFLISFFSIYISSSPATTKYTMGYHRAEILGAFISIFLIWGLLGWLNYEATIRIINRDTQPDIDANLMLITACIGFSCNVINLVALNAECGSKEESDDEDDSEDEESALGESKAPSAISKISNHSIVSRSLHSSLMAVYKPRQSIPMKKSR